MKSDYELGKKVQKHLVELGIETPIKEDNKFNSEYSKQEVEKYFKIIMEFLNLDQCF